MDEEKQDDLSDATWACVSPLICRFTTGRDAWRQDQEAPVIPVILNKPEDAVLLLAAQLDGIRRALEKLAAH